MNLLPPSKISPDGKEVCDWAARMSNHIHLMDKARTLRASIYDMTNTCGSCDKWMKSRQCPKERNVNGRNVGPSMATTKCQQFVTSSSAAAFLESRRRELAEAESQLRHDGDQQP